MANANSIPSVEYLNVCFSYDPSTGDLTWKTRPIEHFRTSRGWKIANTTYQGKIAGHLNVTLGYVLTNVYGRPRYNHRIAWALTHGAWPENEIDHVNGIKHDNRLANLREATHKENSRNISKRSDNRSGFKGASYYKSRGKYQAKINQKHIGYFDTPELAHAAYCAAADRLHGAFANHG